MLGPYQTSDTSASHFIFTQHLLFAAIIVAVIGFFVWIISPSPDPTYICSRCGKTFTDSDNKLSISYSGYCEKCHEDVEFLFGVMEELEELQVQE